MDEMWIKLDNNANRGDTIVEISNTGLMKCKNGKIKPIENAANVGNANTGKYLLIAFSILTLLF